MQSPLTIAQSTRLIVGLLKLMIASVVLAQESHRPDIVIADFESETYGDWKVEGEAFGAEPASGALPGQQAVTGFAGKRLVNSFLRGDNTTGKLTSPEFTIERPWLNFLIGGGQHAGKTCMNLLVDGKTVLTAPEPQTEPGGREELEPASWNVTEFVGKSAHLEIVDRHQGGWGHINVDHIVQSDQRSAVAFVMLKKKLTVDGTHLIVPVANDAKVTLLGLFEGENLVQSFNVALPQGDDAGWLAAYSLDHFGLKGKQITLTPIDGSKLPEFCRAAFDRIKVGAESDALKADDYSQPYRDQFHITTRRGWNNDPNGMVYYGGKFHLYYQYNPFGIAWGNMHWGHVESADLLHWEQKPIALFQKTVGDMAFSGGGFVDFNNSARLGGKTLFVAFTSTGRGECLAYSKDGGLSFVELEANPVVKHNGRDPKIVWYKPEQKWVMAVFDDDACAETEATPPMDGPKDRIHSNIAFWESKNLREWKRTGAFTDPDRMAVFECPELFELPIQGKSNDSRWILFGAENRYFIGRFDGKTFIKESGPLGGSRGALYAAQTFSDVPDGRRIQVGWVRTSPFGARFPNQIVSQSFTLPQELTLRETEAGVRMFLEPVKETALLRDKLLAEGADALKACAGELTEVVVEFQEDGRHDLVINGIDSSFTGRRARIFTDRTFNEIYADGGLGYAANHRLPDRVDSTETVLKSGTVKSLKVYRLKSIWPQN